MISKNWEDIWELRGITEAEFNKINKKKGVNIADNLILCKKDENDRLVVKVAIRKKEREGTKKRLREYLQDQGFALIYTQNNTLQNKRGHI